MVVPVLRDRFWYFSCIFLLGSFFAPLFSVKSAYSQSLPVGLSPSLEENYRRGQLLDTDSSEVSYLIRPIAAVTDASANSTLKILPLLWKQQFNTHHPYGWNDGSMILANGYQTQLSGGVFFKYGLLSVQLRPELVFAENKNYRELHEANNGEGFRNAVASFLNRIDLPSRFGQGSYTRLHWGQSSVRLTFDPISIGLSNENLWWGPGRYNALLMSNNAAGFKHLTLNTSKPVKTALGLFELQIIGGRLDGSEVAAPEGLTLSAKPEDWRYLSGMVFTYKPKWLSGLSLGFDRTFVIYHEDMGKSIGDYFPLFSALRKKQFNDAANEVNSEDQKNRDQNFSLFARWVLKESKMEIYAQYGRTDFSWDLRDLFVEPEHSRAYVIGFQKLISLRKADEYIEAGIELTQMEGSNTGLLRDQPSWYLHARVPAGYTHKGQVIGAGIGPESNMQTYELSWIKGLKRIGLAVDHLVHNDGLSRTVRGDRKSWTDLVVTGKCDWAFKDVVLNSRLSWIRSANYLYENKENNPNHNPSNLNLQLGILYHL